MGRDRRTTAPARGKTTAGAGKRKKSDSPAAEPRPKQAKGGGTAVRVRMYRHGLGDCFLLCFPRKRNRDFRILIDCGIIQGTPLLKKEGDVLEKVVADLKKATRHPDSDAGKPTIDVLVATHEHWDHLAGFAVLTKEFEEFDIKEVWLAWTEDPKDPVANQLRRERAEKVNALKLGLDHARAELGVDPQLGADAGATDDLNRVSEVLSFFGVDPTTGAGLGVTADGDAVFGVKGKPKLSVGGAMDWCRNHKSAKVSFWRPGKVIDLDDEVKGLRAYVLGP